MSSMSSSCGTLPERSMPASAITSTTSGWTAAAGRLPAERASWRPAAARSNSACAIWERPAFWMQTNSTWLTPRPSLPDPARPRAGAPRRAGTGRHADVAERMRRNVDHDRPAAGEHQREGADQRSSLDAPAPLKQQHVSPDALALPQPFAQSDRAKPAGVVECDAGRVLGEDAGLHR